MGIVVRFEVAAASVVVASQLESTLISLVQDTSSTLYTGRVTSSLDSTSLSTSTSTQGRASDGSASEGSEMPIVVVAGAAAAVLLCCAVAIFMCWCRATREQVEQREADPGTWTSPVKHRETPGVHPNQSFDRSKNTGIFSERAAGVDVDLALPKQGNQAKQSVFT